MATPILTQVSLDLAYKLQDPVLLGTANGARLTAAERLRYIIRGYRRLVRFVILTHPELISRLFTKYISLATPTSTSGGVVTSTILPNVEIFDVYVRQPVDEYYVKGIRIPVEIVLDVDSGQNEFYTPDINKGQFYWYIQDGNLHILPTVTYETKILYRPDIATTIETQMSGVGYGGSQDLDMPSDHADILLSSAAAEAYMDINQQDMVNMYKNDMNEQLAILAKKQQMDEKRDEI